ncbi:hypothetical protein D3C87_482480 [compost metagenome]
MKYPYRIFIKYAEGESKLKTIQEVNRFLNNDIKGEYQKYNTLDPETRNLRGLEIAFADHKDAVLFRLGFNIDGQEVTAKTHKRFDREEKERV